MTDSHYKRQEHLHPDWSHLYRNDSIKGQKEKQSIAARAVKGLATVAFLGGLGFLVAKALVSGEAGLEKNIGDELDKAKKIGFAVDANYDSPVFPAQVCVAEGYTNQDAINACSDYLKKTNKNVGFNPDGSFMPGKDYTIPDANGDGKIFWRKAE